MTWYPLQAAIKMSTIPGAIRATLDVLLDHINPAREDPTRPDTLTVWESRELLADETGFSEVTIRDHLKRLRGEKDLRKGQRVMVLKCTAAAQSHRAARYELLPAALDALVDPPRLEAFEAHPCRVAHPYHRWRQWRAAQMASAEDTEAVGVSSFPQDPADESFGESTFPQTSAVGVSSFPQLGQAPSPEFPVVDLDKQELTRPDAPTAPMAQAFNREKAEAASPFWCAACGFIIPTCQHRTIYARPSARSGGPLTLVRHAPMAANPAEH
jgi:hypothetical protein